MTPSPFVFERTVNAPAAKVWQAIADKEEMKKWYFDLAEFRPEVGFKFEFEGGPEHKTYLHLCEVTEVVPERKLTYSWRYDGYEGNSYVTFELIPEGESQTLVRLTHTGLETFPSDNPDLAKENFVAGWTDIIGNHLPAYLEKSTEAAVH